ncbi:MAG: hypothetical protein ACHQM6_10565, partial [Candidatus Kapaibacterium sp.]
EGANVDSRTDFSPSVGKEITNSKANAETPPNGLKVRSTDSEEMELHGLTIHATGIINESQPVKLVEKAKHYPMSNKNRTLVKEYEKLHGKAQLQGESFRDMFDRVVEMMQTGKSEVREMLMV